MKEVGSEMPAVARCVAGLSASAIQHVLKNKTLAAILVLLGKVLVCFGALPLKV